MQYLNLEEQEQLNKLKNFWCDYKIYIYIIVVAIIIITVSALSYNRYSSNNNQEIATQYMEFIQISDDINNDKNNTQLDNKIITSIAEDQKITKIYSLVNNMQQQFTKHEYTAFASLLASQIAFSHHQFDVSIKYLTWLINNATDNLLIDVAKLRLADVYIENKHNELALDLLLKSKHNPQFNALYSQKLADIYLINNEPTKAINLYKQALGQTNDDNNLAGQIQMKLDAIGN